MRESRTSGSVRGACDETHVPTATRALAHVVCCISSRPVIALGGQVMLTQQTCPKAMRR